MHSTICNVKNEIEHIFFEIYLDFFFQITAVDCIWAEWGTWGQCSKTCGDGGSRERIRVKELEEANGGTCNGQSTDTEQDCGYDPGTNGCPSGKKYLVSINITWVKFFKS